MKMFSLLIFLVLFFSCGPDTAHLGDPSSSGTVNPVSPVDVDLNSISGLPCPGPNAISGSCIPDGATVVVDCGAGSTSTTCSNGTFSIAAVSFPATCPRTCTATITDQYGNSGTDSEHNAYYAAELVTVKTMDDVLGDGDCSSGVCTATQGETVIFSIKVSNLGSHGATGVQTLDLCPAGTGYQAHSSTIGTYDSSTGIWNIGALANGASATLELSCMIRVASGSVKNCVKEAKGNEYDPTSSGDDYCEEVKILAPTTTTVYATTTTSTTTTTTYTTTTTTTSTTTTTIY